MRATEKSKLKIMIIIPQPCFLSDHLSSFPHFAKYLQSHYSMTEVPNTHFHPEFRLHFVLFIMKSQQKSSRRHYSEQNAGIHKMSFLFLSNISLLLYQDG